MLPPVCEEQIVPRYRFHVFNNDHTIDDEGKTFPNLPAARVYAIDCARGIMADELRIKGAIDLSHWIEIEDEEGEMDVVPFGEAIQIKPSAPL